MCHALGIETPRVSLIHCSEEVNAKYFPYTVAYGDLIHEAKDGEFGDCVLDGPLDVKTSLDASSLETKRHSVAHRRAGRCFDLPRH